MSEPTKRTVLVIGSGGREHALSDRLLRSASVARVVACPGNPGMALSGIEVRPAEPLKVARELRPDLVVIGPEVPLCAGLADELRAAGFCVYGPSAAAAQLEGSKAFMKEVCERASIPTARHVTVRNLDQLGAALEQFSAPPVVKADGLCAGKGVVVADSFEEAAAAARQMLSGEAFGDAGRTVVLEERLQGEEVSVHAVCDGQRLLVLPAIADHKRIGEGDTGPNTGGMGTFGPAPAYTPELSEAVKRSMLEPLVRGMEALGKPFIGTIFAGLMLTPDHGPMLLEVNVRFGDPETEVLMNLLDGDFAELLFTAASGALNAQSVTVREAHGLCVILAAAGYPTAPLKGAPISGLDQATPSGVCIYHAGTEKVEQQFRVAGGRVLAVTAVASSLATARDNAYAACERIHFEGMQYRRDIGRRALPEQ